MNDDLDTLVAEIYEGLRDPRATLARQQAERSALPDVDLSDQIAAILELIDAIPEPRSTKHDGECWRRHAPCLAGRIADILNDVA